MSWCRARTAMALCALGLPLAGCAPASTSAAGRDLPLPQAADGALAGVADVAFPARPHVTTTDLAIGGRAARVVTATYVEPAAYLPFHYDETPLLMEARVIRFDARSPADGDASQAFGDELRADFSRVAHVVSSARATVAGVPGYAFELDVPVTGPVSRLRLRRGLTARVSLRVALGSSSVSIFLTAYWRGRLLDDDARRLELEEFLGSARVSDPWTGLSSDGAPTADLARAVAGVLAEVS